MPTTRSRRDRCSTGLQRALACRKRGSERGLRVSVENTHSMADEATTGLASSLIGTVLSERYRLEAKLGSGGVLAGDPARGNTPPGGGGPEGLAPGKVRQPGPNQGLPRRGPGRWQPPPPQRA